MRYAVQSAIAGANALTIRGMMTAQRLGGRLVQLRRRTDGQSTWVNELMILGLVVLAGGAVFAFWKSGGLAWVNSQLQSFTQF